MLCENALHTMQFLMCPKIVMLLGAGFGNGLQNTFVTRSKHDLLE